MEEKKSNIWIGILVVLVIIVFSLSAYFYFQTKKTAVPGLGTIATNSPDELANKPGPLDPTNAPLYTFDCPPGTSYTIDKEKGDGITKPLVQVTCTDKANANNKVRIYTMAAGSKEITEPGFTYTKSFDSESGGNKVFISSNNQALFDQTVASFSFTQ